MSEVRTSGPLFDGRARAAMDHFIHEEPHRLAQVVEDKIHTRLGEVIRHPTGRYESRIHEEMQADDIVVTDYPIVYGPWLEGVGSRNSPKTRFPGYFTFRTVSQEVNGELPGLVAEHVKPTVEEMR